ncbi:MAG: site-specific DNA-methyltransferase [Phycisphaeraceae bacterium]
MAKRTTAVRTDTIVTGDCIALMSGWQPGRVDLIFADPPYNIGYAYGDHYDDNRDHEEYVRWTQRWINGCARLLKPSGSLYILIGDEYAAEVRLHLRTLEKQGQLLFRNWIIWHYTFGQRCKVKFNRSHAHLFYCVGSAALTNAGRPRSNLTTNPPFTFNYDAVAVPSARQTTYNDRRANPNGKLPDDTWYLRPQEAESVYFRPGEDTWYQSRLCGTFKERQQWHPCQLPETLLERIIKVSSNQGDLVFDPFAGSGTTLAVAHKLGRKWLGCELSRQYAKKALARITGPNPKRLVTNNGKRAGRQTQKSDRATRREATTVTSAD